MTTFTPLLALFLLLAGSAAADESDLVARADAQLASLKDGPGCGVAVLHRGKIVYRRDVGVANLDHDLPIDARTVFNLASVSKQFTAAVALALADDGKLALTDPVRKYVPELPAYADRVTIADLIHHTSGIREYPHLFQLAGREATTATAAEVLLMLARQRGPNFDAGIRASYSNSNYFLLGLVIERVTRMSLRQAADKLVFAPAGMTATHFRDDPREVIKHRATGYSPRREGGFAMESVQNAVVGHGGVFSTVDDLVSWEQYLRAHPELNRLSMAGKLRSGESSDYAFGLELDTHRGLTTVGHGGSFNGYSADLVRFPAREVSAICACNRFGLETARITRALAEVFIGDDFPTAPAASSAPAAISAPVAELEAVTGVYVNPDTNNIRRILVRGDQLIYSRGTSESVLAPIGNRAFVMRDVPDLVVIRFEGDRMITTVNGGRSTTHIARRAQSYTPQDLQHIAGVYRSDELQVSYEIIYRDGKLFLSRPGLDGQTPLVAEFDSVFSAPGTGLLDLVRADGHIRGFIVSTIRARGIRFERVE